MRGDCDASYNGYYTISVVPLAINGKPHYVSWPDHQHLFWTSDGYWTLYSATTPADGSKYHAHIGSSASTPPVGARTWGGKCGRETLTLTKQTK